LTKISNDEMDLAQIKQIIWKIDEEENILEFKMDNGLCLWMLSRYFVYTLLLNKVVQRKTFPKPTVKERAGFKSKISQAKYLLNSLRRNPLSIKTEFNCLNILSSLACVPSANGYISRVSGFMNDLPSIRTLNLIKSNNGFYQSKYVGVYRFYDFVLLRPALKNKSLLYKNGLDIVTSQTIKSFIEKLREKIDSALQSEDFLKVELFLQNSVSVANDVELSVRQLLLNTSPKLILIEDANYGSVDNCIITKVAKQMNIATAEIQHGLLDIGYQYADKLIRNPLFALHKTDYILTFGDYFSKFIRSSSKNISIGNAFLEKKVEELNKQSRSPSSVPRIVFITQREYTDGLIPILKEALQAAEVDYNLIIRLHPSDTTGQSKYESFFGTAVTSFSIVEDIYELIQSADYIIGSYSTALYECSCFGKTPFIHRNEFSDHFVPPGIGILFETAAELAQLLKTPMPPVNGVKKEYYWKVDSEENFLNFYSTHISKNERMF
jgi:hypothetical protein